MSKITGILKCIEGLCMNIASDNLLHDSGFLFVNYYFIHVELSYDLAVSEWISSPILHGVADFSFCFFEEGRELCMVIEEEKNLIDRLEEVNKLFPFLLINIHCFFPMIAAAGRSIAFPANTTLTIDGPISQIHLMVMLLMHRLVEAWRAEINFTVIANIIYLAQCLHVSSYYLGSPQ